MSKAKQTTAAVSERTCREREKRAYDRGCREVSDYTAKLRVTHAAELKVAEDARKSRDAEVCGEFERQRSEFSLERQALREQHKLELRAQADLRAEEQKAAQERFDAREAFIEKNNKQRDTREALRESEMKTLRGRVARLEQALVEQTLVVGESLTMGRELHAEKTRLQITAEGGGDKRERVVGDLMTMIRASLDERARREKFEAEAKTPYPFKEPGWAEGARVGYSSFDGGPVAAPSGARAA